MLVVLATTCASRLLLTKTKFGQTLRRPCGSTRDGRETSVRNSVSSFCGKAGITGKGSGVFLTSNMKTSPS